MLRLVHAVILLYLTCAPALADFSGPVVSVLDADTLEVLHNKRSQRVCLHGTDHPVKGVRLTAPELGKPRLNLSLGKTLPSLFDKEEGSDALFLGYCGQRHPALSYTRECQSGSVGTGLRPPVIPHLLP